VTTADGLSRALAGRRVLVTGAAGFVGRALVAFARQRGAEVTGVDRDEADIREPAAVARLFAGAQPEWVIHAAGLADWRADPALLPEMLATHVLGTAHVLEAARAAGARRVVCFGSAGEYGAARSPLDEEGPTLPVDPYSTSKRAATELALLYQRAFRLPCTVVRPFNIYGPGEPPRRLFPSLFAQARAGGGRFACTAGQQVRDFVHVDDVAEGAWRAAAGDTAGAIINLGTGVGTTVRAAIEQAAALAGGNVEPQFGALPHRPGEPMELVASVVRCRERLGWTPGISLSEGLRRTFEGIA
jgi:nucleoside-diphosphate-sugar epimerase